MSQAVSSLREKMQGVLDGAQAAFRQQVREFIARPDLAPPSPEVSKADYRARTLGGLQEIMKAGYSRLPFPEKYEGTDSLEQYIHFAEILGHHDLSLCIKYGVQVGLFGAGLFALGTHKHHEQYLPGVMDGSLLGGFAMTEIGGGSNVQGLRTTAIYNHEKRCFVINTPSESARKAYIGNAAQDGRAMVVFANLKMPDGESQGVHAFMVPVRDRDGKTLDGVAIEDCGHKGGLNGVDNGYIAFDHVEVPYDALLDRFAQIDGHGQYQSPIAKKSARFFKMIGTLVMGRIAIGAFSISAAKNALAAAIPYAADREVFGEKLLDQQNAQTRIFSHLAETYALHFASRLVAEKKLASTPDTDPLEVETLAAAIKAEASDASFQTIDEARTLCAGSGYMSEERYGALRNDVDIFRTFEGDNTVLRLLIAKNRVTDLGLQFNKASLAWQAEMWIAAKVNSLAVKFNFLNKYFSAPDRLIDPAFQARIFAQREQDMLYALAPKLKAYSQKLKYDPACKSAIPPNPHQDEMIAYAHAYSERVAMEQFIDVVNAEKDPETKAALKNLCDSYAVTTMRRNAAWYLENGYMAGRNTKALAAMEHAINKRTLPQAVELVEAFAIPESLLSLPKQPTPAPL